MDARIDRQIARFEPIGLEELNRASALMKRLERKYVLDAGMLPDFLGALAGDFRILVIDGRTRHRYQSSYFDTADLMCFRAHNQQRPNRFKLRARHYVDSGLQFLELKEKPGSRRPANRVLRWAPAISPSPWTRLSSKSSGPRAFLPTTSKRAWWWDTTA